MSNKPAKKKKKKNYQTAAKQAPAPVAETVQESRLSHYVHEYGALAAFIIIVLFMIAVMSNSSACSKCADACDSPKTDAPVSVTDVTSTDVSDSDAFEYHEAIDSIDSFTYNAPEKVDPSYTPIPNSTSEEIIANQLGAPQPGDTIAVLSTKYGDMKIRLFEDQAPLACENFKQLVNHNAFDGTTIYNVSSGIWINFGSLGGSDSIYGGRYESEADRGLYAFTGAVFTYYDESSGGYRYGIIQSSAAYFHQIYSDVDLVKDYGYPSGVSDLYTYIGGFPGLDKQTANRMEGSEYIDLPEITIFGQVYSGNKILYAIGSVDKDPFAVPLDEIPVTAYLAKVLWNNIDEKNS